MWIFFEVITILLIISMALFIHYDKLLETAFSALKVFFSFLELIHLDSPKNITNSDIRDLRMFLEGGKREGRIWNKNIQVRRENQTFNNYLNVYRNFLDKMYGITDSSLFEITKTGTTVGKCFFAHTQKKVKERYTINKNLGQQLTLNPYN